MILKNIHLIFLLAFLAYSHCFAKKHSVYIVNKITMQSDSIGQPALCKAIVDTVSRYFSAVFNVVTASPVGESLLLAAHSNPPEKPLLKAEDIIGNRNIDYFLCMDAYANSAYGGTARNLFIPVPMGSGVKVIIINYYDSTLVHHDTTTLTFSLHRYSDGKKVASWNEMRTSESNSANFDSVFIDDVSGIAHYIPEKLKSYNPFCVFIGANLGIAANIVSTAERNEYHQPRQVFIVGAGYGISAKAVLGPVFGIEGAYSFYPTFTGSYSFEDAYVGVCFGKKAYLRNRISFIYPNISLGYSAVMKTDNKIDSARIEIPGARHGFSASLSAIICSKFQPVTLEPFVTFGIVNETNPPNWLSIGIKAGYTFDFRKF